MWKIVFPKKLHDELHQFLFSLAPKENGCFLLGNAYKTKKGRPVILVTGIVKPDENSWNGISEHSLEPSSRFINRAVTIAEETNSSLLLAHTHPNPMHPAGFSYIDEQSNEKLFENLSGIIDEPLGSLVFSKYGICGVMFENHKILPISTVRISGHLDNEYLTIDSNSKKAIIDEKFDRQVRAISEEIHRRLQEMCIAVIGVGGTGSAVATQLARMGVKKLLLIDKDVIESTNVTRVYGSTKQDCINPRSKVEAVKQYIETFSNTRVDALQVDITKTNVTQEIINYDVIFSCTDNLTSREILNKISLNYFIPLIDVGCKIDIAQDGKIKQSIVKVQAVTADDACLWCTGTLDGKIILQESLSDAEKEKLAKEGYYQSIEKQPSIITTTTKAASIAVEKLLCLIGTFGEQYHSRTYIETRDGIFFEDTPEIKENCVCHQLRGMAEKRKMEVMH